MSQFSPGDNSKKRCFSSLLSLSINHIFQKEHPSSPHPLPLPLNNAEGQRERKDDSPSKLSRDRLTLIEKFRGKDRAEGVNLCKSLGYVVFKQGLGEIFKGGRV